MIEGYFKILLEKDCNMYVYKWEPKEEVEIVGVVQIAHGMAEHAGRYKGFAELLTKAGYVVFANDHRGHGKTAKSIEDIGYICDGDGFKTMEEDMYLLTKNIKEQYKGIPLFLFGHSMGSFLSQRFIQRRGEELQGVILSGSNGNPNSMAYIGKYLAKIETVLRGEKAKSPLMNILSFGNYNKYFKPNRTNFDWLSRDEKQVDKYLEDNCCGTLFTTSFFYYFIKGLMDIHKKDAMNSIPKELPIFIISGDMDPVGEHGKGVLRLVNSLKEVGIKEVSYKLYKGARHELLNEINKEEVMEDILHWINSHIKK